MHLSKSPMRLAYMIIVLTLFVFTRQSLASDSWSTPVTLGTETNSIYGISTAKVAVDPSGNAVAVWVHDANSPPCLKASTRQVGGDWSSPVTISIPIPDQWIINATVKIDPQGNAIALWSTLTDVEFKGTIQASALPFGSSSWSPAEELPSNPDSGFSIQTTQLAFDSEGNALAVWTAVSEDYDTYSIRSARAEAGTLDWTLMPEIQPNVCNSLQLAMNPSGDAVIIWCGINDSRDTSLVESATLSSSSLSWTVKQAIQEDAMTPVVAIDGAGNAIAAWWGWMSVQAYSLYAEASVWNKTVLPIDYYTSAPRLAVDLAGNAHLLWQASYNKYGPDDLQASTLPPLGSEWSTPVTVLPRKQGSSSNYAIAVDQFGNATAVWGNEMSGLVQAATLPKDKSWSSPVTLASANVEATPVLAVSTTLEGSCIVIYSDTEVNYPHDNYVKSVNGMHLYPTNFKNWRLGLR